MADKKQDKAEGAAAAADGDAPDNDPMAGAGAPDGESAAESTDASSSGQVDDAAALDPGDADLVETLVAERDALKDQLLRALADVENMRRRTERELETSRKYGHTGFARDLVGAIDNLALALDAAPGEGDMSSESVAALVTGLEMSWTEIQSTMERHGVKRSARLARSSTTTCIRRCSRCRMLTIRQAPLSRLCSMAMCFMTGCCARQWSACRRRRRSRRSPSPIRKTAD